MIVVKLVCATVLVIVVFAFGLVPVFFKNKIVFSIVTSFSGGVLLGTVMMHLLPEAIAHGNQLLCFYNIKYTLPVGGFATVIGFIFILLIEKLVEEYRISSLDERTPLLKDEGATSSSTPPKPIGTRRKFGSYLMLIALSLHSVFEGLAIGFAGAVSDVLTLFAAVLIHKLCLSFAVGVKLQSEERTLVERISGLSAFAISSPIGVVIGIIVTSTLNSKNLIMATFTSEAIATGTFLYITFMEVLSPEFNTRYVNQLLKMLALIVGFTVISVTVIFLHHYSHVTCD